MPTGYVPISAAGLTGVGSLKGWNFTETSGSAGAHVRLRNGAVGGEIVASVKLGAGQSAGENYDDPINVSGRVFVQIVTGAVEGALYGG
jgi:hypothetical protein